LTGRRARAVALAVSLVCLGSPAGHATTMEKVNIAKLMQRSDLILVDQVVRVTDGFDKNNLPFTEVTLRVAEAIKGIAAGDYTFRQFGLVAPKETEGGRTYLGVSPEGWPKFKEGEQTMVFLYPTTSLGFQSTVGLFQGKFQIENDQVFNEIENAGLFDGLSVDPHLLTKEEQKLVGTVRGRCPSETFRGFVRKAVQESWFGQAPANPRVKRDLQSED